MRGGFPNLPSPKSINRPPTPRSFPAMPTGPREFRDRLKPILMSGPGAAPPDFVQATTSGDEWRLYWALYRVFEPNEDPREPPFSGSKDPSKWVYQYFFEQGRRELGGSVVDFVVFPFADYNSILIRLQTEAWHIFAPAKKQSYDRIQAARLGQFGEVYDVYSQWIMKDDTGEAAIQAVKACLQGIAEVNPLLSGQAERVRV